MTWQSEKGAVRRYVYTADDERLAVYDGARWTWTIRDLGGRVLREFTSDGADGTANWKWRRDTIYRGSQLLAAEVQNYDVNEVPQGRQTLHFHLDHLGTPRLITDAAGFRIGLHSYYPFGAELAMSPSES